MSRILRRPLFRGGPVSSYGTGIASGLADGGRVGFKKGGAGNRTISAPEPNIIWPQNLGTYANRTRGGAGAMYQGIGGPMWTGSEIMNFIKDNPKWGGINFANTLNPKSRYALEATTDDEMLSVMRNMMDPDLALMDPDKTAEENTTVDTEEIWDDYDAGNEAKGIIVNEGEQTVDQDGKPVIESEESTTIDEAEIRERAELFNKMLSEGFEKEKKSAQISDASDYALKFFEETVGKGKGTKEAAGAVAGFALAKPSKTEGVKAEQKKTKQTATVMAINDYLAGEKSERELKKILATADYKGNINLANQIELIERKRKDVGTRISEAAAKAGIGGVATISTIENVLRPEGKKITKIPKDQTGKWKPDKEDEGSYIIEEETKNVFEIISGVPVKIY